MNKILVLAETAMSASRGLTFAKSLGGSASLLTNMPQGGAMENTIDNIATTFDNYYTCEGDLAEAWADVTTKLVSDHKFTHVVAEGTNFAKNILPRAAALSDSQPLSEITGVLSDSTFTRLGYAGNAVYEVELNEPTKFLLFRGTAFDPEDTQDALQSRPPAEESKSEVQSITPKDYYPTVISNDISTSDRPDLGVAPVVVAGGRALKNGENFSILEELADHMGGAVGASRAAVDAGYVSNDLQIGQTGKVVAPDKYIAVGISGAIQHLAGMKDSKVIYAINKDPEAPIFQIADYGLVADLFDVVPQINAAMK